MHTKLLTTAIIFTLALVGLGIVSLTKKSEQSQNTPAVSMSGMDESAKSADVMPVVENQIVYQGFAVSPKILKIKKGTTVTWINKDAAQHDVMPTTESADFVASELFGKGESYEFTFNTVGTYNYLCSPHPYMKGTIEVTE